MDNVTLTAIQVEQKYIRELFERNNIILQQAEEIEKLKAELDARDKEEDKDGKK